MKIQALIEIECDGDEYPKNIIDDIVRANLAEQLDSGVWVLCGENEDGEIEDDYYQLWLESITIKKVEIIK